MRLTKMNLSVKADALQARLDDFKFEVETMRDDAQAYFDDRSETWQDGDVGQEYQDMLNDLDSSCDQLSEALDSLRAVAQA